MISMKHLQSLWITLEYCMFFYTYAKHVSNSERSCYLLCFIYTFILLAALLTACATVSTGKLKSLHCSLTLNDNLYVTVMVSIWQCWLNQRQRACSETDAEQLRRLSTSTTDDNNEWVSKGWIMISGRLSADQSWFHPWNHPQQTSKTGCYTTQIVFTNVWCVTNWKKQFKANAKNYCHKVFYSCIKLTIQKLSSELFISSGSCTFEALKHPLISLT
jgi:hypothetical protein